MEKQTYIDRSLERDITLFAWDSNDIKIPLNPEFHVTVNGSLGWDKVHNKWVVGMWNGVLDELGDFTTYVCHTLATTPETYELKNHDEVIVCGNTPLYRPYTKERDYYATMKSETDISIMTQLINSRLNKTIVAYSDSQKKQIEKAYEAIKLGYPMIVVTSLLEGLEIQDLTDSADIEKMQYLSSFYKELEKRECNDFGIDMESIDKRAQVNNTELLQNDDYITSNYLIMFESRMRFVKEMQENGIEISITRNPIFFDEPEESDVEEGTFEIKEEQEEAPEVKEEEADGNDDKESEETKSE